MAQRNRKNKSVMTHAFSDLPRAQIPRSSFDRSHGYKTTLDASKLYPVFLDEALPGDTFTLGTSGIARLATPIAPFMDNMFMDIHYFACPLRLIWENWEKFNGAQDAPGDSTDYLIPQMTAPTGGYEELSIHDYMGIPPGIEGLSHSSLFHRAYNLAYDQWYRDQNLINPPPINKGDGPDDPADYQLLRRGKRADYFTSALPWPQKGESVDIPLGQTAEVIPRAANIAPTYRGRGDTVGQFTSVNLENTVQFQNGGTDGSTPYPWEDPGLVADLSEATAATINQLRQAFQVQKMLERDARGGTRYIEIIKSHFGVSSPDSRLQRVEYLGGGTTPIYVNPVAQTSETDPTGNDASPQGNLAAVGTAMVDNMGFTKSFTEHCIIIGLMSVRADLTYQQGLNRMFSRETRYDFYWPALSMLGEQAVLNKEIYAQGTPEDEQVFGYQERYAEYRYKPSLITGRMRSSSDLTLDNWHLSQDFGSLPALNAQFIEENVPVERVIAVQTEPHFIVDLYFNLRTARPMPMYGIPGLIDHF